MYGEGAVTPGKIKLRSWRTAERENEIQEDMKPSIDTTEIGKMQATINLDRYKEEMRRWKNRKVKLRE